MKGLDDLTERQRQVAALVVQGMPDKLIAHRIGLKQSTIKVHLAHAYKRLGLPLGQRRRECLAVLVERERCAALAAEHPHIADEIRAGA